MPDLIAQGSQSDDRWRRELPSSTSGQEITLGRTGADWNVPWDSMISRNHVRLIAMADDRLQVRRMTTARNPVFHSGKQTTQFVVVPGDHFVIGQTTFTLVNRPGASESSATNEVTEHAYNHQVLRKRHFRDAASRIEMLGRLPDLIASSLSDEELLVRVTGVLLQATPNASGVAVVAVSNETMTSSDSDTTPEPTVEILHYDSRTVGRDGPAVSARLVRNAIAQRESILHLWTGNRAASPTFTASEEADWAFCVPLRSDACPGWALYVTGGLMADVHHDLEQSLQAAPENLQDDVKFTELVATTIGNLRQSRRLQRRQSEMRHFFAPMVLEALATQQTDDVLEPREANLSVMFCDLRGFSKQSERDAADLLGLLARVSDALGVMTRHILAGRGVIGDFHGDAAMGFWGWPLAQDDSAIRALEAASRIRDDYHEGDKVGGFRCGIGIATGRAVAGRIGTVDQVKVTAFGPVVNLASRLEGLTKRFGVEIILDEATHDLIADSTEHSFVVRRLGKLVPAGMTQPVNAYELMIPGTLSTREITHHQEALALFEAGNWPDAENLLRKLPGTDRPTEVLKTMIRKHNGQPPSSWNEVVFE